MMKNQFEWCIPRVVSNRTRFTQISVSLFISQEKQRPTIS